VLLAIAAGTSLVTTAAFAVTLPPRGAIDRPEYYAFGSDVPRALRALATVQRSTDQLDQELNAQLVGLARLVTAPADRPPVTDAPRMTIASDLHNNSLNVPLLARTARGGPVLFAGDLTDRGTPLETSFVRQIVRAGHPFVFVSGNHDSDTLDAELRRDGAIVLDRNVVRVGGVRVAGYPSPELRLAADGYRDNHVPEPSDEDKEAFAAWLRPIEDKVDIVMVHNAKLAATALAELEAIPPEKPIVFVVGHTHHASLHHEGTVTVIDGGSIGGGGTGNLTEHTPVALASLAYARAPFEPLAVDLVAIDPGSGSATARRERLDG
jgi:predicted phosphodiesterase